MCVQMFMAERRTDHDGMPRYAPRPMLPDEQVRVLTFEIARRAGPRGKVFHGVSGIWLGDGHDQACQGVSFTVCVDSRFNAATVALNVDGCDSTRRKFTVRSVSGISAK